MQCQVAQCHGLPLLLHFKLLKYEIPSDDSFERQHKEVLGAGGLRAPTMMPVAADLPVPPLAGSTTASPVEFLTFVPSPDESAAIPSLDEYAPASLPEEAAPTPTPTEASRSQCLMRLRPSWHSITLLLLPHSPSLHLFHFLMIC